MSLRPYTMRWPFSPGRLFLANAVTHWSLLHYGLSAEDIQKAFETTSGADREHAQYVVAIAELFGEVLARGTLRSSARPMGGGEPQPIDPALWELDDPVPRIAASALCLEQPFDVSAAPTHWLFVDLGDFNAMIERSAEVMSLAPEDEAQFQNASEGEPVSPSNAPSRSQAQSGGDRLIRLAEVVSRTGLSRSTIYTRMKQSRFPRSRSLGGSIVAWSEREVDDWVASRSG